MHTDRREFLGVEYDRLSFDAVIHRLSDARAVSPYSYIVTPNVDHVVRLHSSADLAPIYRQAALCLCDSRVLRLLAKLGGVRLPVVAGSDLTHALMTDVVRPGDRLAIVGATPQVVDTLRARLPEVEILHYVAPMGLREDAVARQTAAAFVAATQARFTFFAVGSPQQEMIARDVLGFAQATGVGLCIGASLEFLTGEQKRAPRILQVTGLEWAHRLASNPSRMWRRYLVDGMAIFPLFMRSRHARRLRWLVVGGALALAVAAVGLLVHRQVGKSNAPNKPLSGNDGQSHTVALAAVVPIDLPPPDLVRQLTTEQAVELNAERPFVARPDKPAAGLSLAAGMPGRLNALACLTQAVYYEAASEGMDGGRAVAQVVINRIHHAGYPASVCGVVYQGSERQTGCQFSFTCDGSLQRIPNPAIWDRSHKIAESALAGHVFAPVGHATYYHADYVVPYWADSLDKTIQIGRHIFYRLRGSLGESRTFRQGYIAQEAIPLAPPPVLPDPVLPGPIVVPAIPSLIADGPVQAPLNNKVDPVAVTSLPMADISTGTLIADRDAPARTTKRRTPSIDCPVVGSDDKKIRPLAPNKAQAIGQAAGC